MSVFRDCNDILRFYCRTIFHCTMQWNLRNGDKFYQSLNLTKITFFSSKIKMNAVTWYWCITYKRNTPYCCLGWLRWKLNLKPCLSIPNYHIIWLNYAKYMRYTSWRITQQSSTELHCYVYFESAFFTCYVSSYSELSVCSSLFFLISLYVHLFL